MNPIKNKKDLETTIDEIRNYAYLYLDKYSPSKQQLRTYLFKKLIKKINKDNADFKVGEKIFEELPQIDFGRIAAQSAKQVISQRVKEAEKTRQYEDFVDKESQILSGIIILYPFKGNIYIILYPFKGNIYIHILFIIGSDMSKIC